jgi:hypothetical protein
VSIFARATLDTIDLITLFVLAFDYYYLLIVNLASLIALWLM